MVDYSKWDKMVKELEKMDAKEISKNIKCEIGKPLTENEFRKLKENEKSSVMHINKGKVELDMKNI